MQNIVAVPCTLRTEKPRARRGGRGLLEDMREAVRFVKNRHPQLEGCDLCDVSLKRLGGDLRLILYFARDA